MAYWNINAPLTGKIEPEEIVKPGDGVNQYKNSFEIAKSEAADMSNLTNTKYPAISVRDGRSYQFASSSAPLTAINGAGVRNNSIIHVVDGTRWKYWNTATTDWVTVSTSCISGKYKFVEFNTQTTRYTLLCGTSYLESYNGTTNADITGAPATKFYAIDDFRAFALDGSVIYYSAAGDPTDWTTVDDAGEEVCTSMVGVGTGITAFNDMVIAFGEHSMHILYGNTPFDFQLSDPINVGCVSNDSIIQHNNVLYWLDYNRIMSFTGGYPTEISQKAKTYVEGINYSYKTNVTAGKYKKYILWSIPYGSTTNNKTLQFDTELQTWYVWDIGIVNWVEIGEYLHGIDTGGYVWKFFNGTADGSTAINWSYTTGVWNAFPLKGKKVVSDIYALVDLPATSTLIAYYSESVDGTDWTSFYTFTGSANEQNTRLQIPVSALQGINWYRLKFEGTGPCTIFCLEPYIRNKRR